MDAQSPSGKIAGLLTGYWNSQMIYVAAKLDLAGLLHQGAKTSEELAAATQTQPRAMYRLLRALASQGIFAEVQPQRFSNTPASLALLDGAPGSQRAMAIMTGEEHYLSWSELLYCVQTGKTGFEKLYNMPPFNYLAQHPEQAANFDAAMTSVHGRETPAMLAAYDFAGIHVLADVGGGNGSLLIATLQKHPQLQGILYDLPHVVERSRANFAAAGLAARCRCLPGSFFEHVPPGADAYLMRHIIHDWDDAEAVAILKNCRQAMAGNPQARLLVLEAVIPPGNDPMFSKLLDLNMLVIPGGLERTEAEYRQLFKAAGFRLNRIVATATEVSVIEGLVA
ncbi:MAG: methyltransferase [Planctomycetaceae bacterium]